MKVFVPFEGTDADNLLDQLGADEQLVPFQTVWFDDAGIVPPKKMSVNRDAKPVSRFSQAATGLPDRH